MTFGKEMKEAMDRAAESASDMNSYNQLPEIAIEALEHECETVKDIIRYSKKRGRPITSGGHYLAQRLRSDERVEVAEEKRGNHAARYRLKANQSP
jgi:hypothetical protein